jgi:CDP-glycerol glycerophosphotransferase (TagB/SpsB family)
MTDPPDWRYHVTRFLHLYRWCASTSMTGLSHQYDYFCVASEGFKEQFIERGINPNKIRVTGIPNFDNMMNEMKDLKFEHKNFVLVATSDIRETLKYENRKKLIEYALKIASGRKLIFKLHPNEIVKKRIVEIKKYAPDALVYHGVSIDPLLANCDVFITKYSSTIFPAFVLGKEVHCAIDNEELKKLCPIQNNDTSAKNIAEVANELLESSHSTFRTKEKNKYYSDLIHSIKYPLKRKFARTNIGH